MHDALIRKVYLMIRIGEVGKNGKIGIEVNAHIGINVAGVESGAGDEKMWATRPEN